MEGSQFWIYYIPREGKLIHMATLAEARAAVKQGGYLWVDYSQPGKDDLMALAEPLGLHPLAVEDCLDDNQIPKVEDYPEHTFVLFNAFQYFEKQTYVKEIDFFIGDDYLVTVSPLSANGKPLLNGISRLVERDMENVRQGPAFLAHIVLDWVVDQKFVAIAALEEELDEAEDMILTDHAHFNPAQLMHLRRELLELRKSLFHEREVLVKICRRDSQMIPEKAIYFYRDIYDHLAKFFELTESSRDIVTSLMEMYLSMINNQMTRAANDTNITVRRLTFITTIFMPLSLLAGIGGMSEYSMMTGPDNWRITYPLFIAAMVVLGVANYYLLKWFDRQRNKKE
jgi:magnesium transporter